MLNRTPQPSRAPLGTGPKRIRGPFSRWPRTADSALAIALFLASAFVEEGPGDALAIRSLDELPFAVLPLLAAASAGLYWRRRRPLLVLAVAVLAWVLSLATGESHLGGITIVALYSVGRYSTDDLLGEAGVVAAVLALVLDGIALGTPWRETGFGAFVMLTVWYVGRRLRLRQERAAQREREQVAEARRIVAEERSRIARELHDVVAHRVSLMTVQAGAAKAVAAEDLDGALEAMGAVEEAGRQALDELRHLLGVLRPDADRDGLGPQPGLADLPRLIEQIRDAGLDVSFAMDGIPTPLPARLELSAYRIVQEALTNVLKHRGTRARAEVSVRGDGDGITIEVLDDGPGAAVPVVSETIAGGGAGHGIVGMRERALLLGGSLEAGPRPGGGFRVLARLPAGGQAT